MEYDQKILIKYRIERANESIEEGRIAIENGKLFNAENRIYYSIYYTVSALAVKKWFFNF